MKKLLKRFCLGFLNELKEWKVILLIVLMFVVAFKSPSQYKDFIAIAVFVIYSAIIYFFFGGYGNDYDKYDFKNFKFITIRKVIFYIALLIFLDIFVNEARVLHGFFDAWTCQGSPPVSSGCYNLRK
jgi:hypothetical protein